jgi:hypothetical protein
MRHLIWLLRMNARTLHPLSDAERSWLETAGTMNPVWRRIQRNMDQWHWDRAHRESSASSACRVLTPGKYFIGKFRWKRSL